MKNLFPLFVAALALAVPAHAGSPSTPLQSVLDRYIQIQTSLAGDSLKGVPEAASEIAATSKASAGVIPESVAVQAGVMAKATDIKAARETFKPLSAALIAALATEKSISGQYYEAFCPMANASWIQVGKKIANPYFGSDMLSCGEIRKAVGGEPHANLPAKSGMGCCGS